MIKFLKKALGGVRTSAAAAVVVVALVGPYTGYITQKQADAIRDGAVAFGLVSAADNSLKKKEN